MPATRRAHVAGARTEGSHVAIGDDQRDGLADNGPNLLGQPNAEDDPRAVAFHASQCLDEPVFKCNSASGTAAPLRAIEMPLMETPVAVDGSR